MNAPLQGVTVLDLSSVGPGSRCTAVLADLGARVIKITAPASAGRIDPEFYAYGAGRGTHRVRIDLRQPKGRDAFLRLCESSDVVVESFRPGVATRLGIGYEQVRARNARIVYAAITGYGQDGPSAQWAGHDLNYLALGGYLGMQGRRTDGGPAIPGATIADSAAGGLHAALSIVSALLRRSKEGTGTFLDVSTAEGVAWLMSLQIDEYLATGMEPTVGTAILNGGRACYEIYECKDGKWISVAAIEPAFFRNLCQALGCEELAEHQHDPARQNEIRKTLASAFATRERDEWLRDLAHANTCVAPVLSIAEVTRNEHFAARGVFATYEHDGRSFEHVGAVIAGSGSPPPASFDSESILLNAGFQRAEIDELRQAGVIE
ncbi:MAG: CaiB/BaiF CoA transferase family protein [Actinomycetota bacterium]